MGLTPEGRLIKEKTRIDVYYWPPSSISKTPILPPTLSAGLKKLGARRIKNMQELKMFLENKDLGRKSGLSIENFSFKTKILDLGEFEFIRHTNHSKDRGNEVKLDEREVKKQRNQLIETQKDLFGDISDLDDEEIENTDNIGTKVQVNKILAAEVKENLAAETQDVEAETGVKENITTENEVKENLVAETGMLSNNTVDVSNITAKDGERRLKIVIQSFELQQSLTCSVKPRKTIGKALEAFSTKCKLEMEKMQFWCGGRRLAGVEIAASLEEELISVTLAHDDEG